MARLSHGVTGKMGTWQPLGQRAPLTDMQANLITFTTQAFFFLVFKEKHKRWVRPLSWANEPVQPQRVPHAKGSHTWFVLCFRLKSLNNFWMRFPTFSFCTSPTDKHYAGSFILSDSPELCPLSFPIHDYHGWPVGAGWPWRVAMGDWVARGHLAPDAPTTAPLISVKHSVISSPLFSDLAGGKTQLPSSSF